MRWLAMTFEEFEKNGGDLPGLPPALRSLWHDARGNWDEAHRIAQEDGSVDGSWVHAYLHRKEGDISNARYWYARAGKTAYAGSLDEEWRKIATSLLASTRADEQKS